MPQTLILNNMPTYHFTREKASELPGTRVSAEFGRLSYKDFGTFEKAEYFFDGQAMMTIGNCQGSLILIDPNRQGINKLHVGEGLKIKSPHVESSDSHGREGPRVDLAEFDLRYAARTFNDLTEWRIPGKREEIAAEYSQYGWYCIPHRLAQLRISVAGLETKIGELNAHIQRLKTNPKRRYVSERAGYLESDSLSIVALMGFEAQEALARHKELEKAGALTRKQKQAPKILVNTDILEIAAKMHPLLVEVLDFVVPRVDMERAAKYWQEVDSWGNM